MASNIETLNLPRLFDGVVLAGCLVNHAVEPTRRAFLAAARRHVKPGGLLVIQRHDPAWLRTVREGATSEVAGVSLAVDRVVRTQGRIAMTLRYAIDDQVWLHHFEAVALDEADIEALLRNTSFRRVRWHGAERLWATAIPV